MAKPPVCKIMDYGKFKYETKKKANEAKKKQFVIKLKEIKLRPKTDEHDYAVKLRSAREFLEEGHKVKVTIVFRGREIAHREIGQKQLQEMISDLREVGVVEQAPRMEGRSMFMIVGANPKARAAARASTGAAPSAPSTPAPAARPPGPTVGGARPPASGAPRPTFRGPSTGPRPPSGTGPGASGPSSRGPAPSAGSSTAPSAGPSAAPGQSNGPGEG